MKRGTVFLLIFFAANAVAQDLSVKNFTIDPSKPYVYLKFDHIGPRVPVQEDEGNTGLWLRVVNNCRVPIVFSGFMMPDGDSGVGLFDDVVDEEPLIGLVLTQAEVKEYEKKDRERLQKLKHKPAGYSAEVSGIMRVQPGQDLLFSVPLNHVDDDWYMRVCFALDLNTSSLSAGPFTYLQFHESDIPKEVRPAKTSSGGG